MSNTASFDMNRFDREKWILYWIAKRHPEGCEWVDPSPEDKRIIDRSVTDGCVSVMSCRNEKPGLCSPKLYFTRKGADIYIYDGRFLFAKDFGE